MFYYLDFPYIKVIKIILANYLILKKINIAHFYIFSFSNFCILFNYLIIIIS